MPYISLAELLYFGSFLETVELISNGRPSATLHFFIFLHTLERCDLNRESRNWKIDSKFQNGSGALMSVATECNVTMKTLHH